MNDTTYSVSVYATGARKGQTGTSYHVRWKAGGRVWKKVLRNSAQADSLRSALLTAARNGEAFSINTGQPVSWQRADNDMSWYKFACAYTDMKWKSASAKYRKDIARALTAATPAMFTSTKGKPDDADIRRALRRWGFNTKQRADAPEDVQPVLDWVARNAASVSTLTEATTARRMLDMATSRIDGKTAAASTARRNRTILSNAMHYAQELNLFDTNPIRALKWTAPRTSRVVDRRCVVNPHQARALLAAVRSQSPSGPRLVTFFGLLYYAGLRPEEAVNLRKDDITVPPMRWNKDSKQWENPPDDDDWGELHFREATPDVGRDWTDDGTERETRPLKHRAESDSRNVPTHPELTRMLRDHLREFGTASDGRIFRGVRTEELPTITYRRAWDAARHTVLTSAEHRRDCKARSCPVARASPLARRVYDLRHACLSTWLNGGVYPTQVAEYAGHGVDVLLRIYAKCIIGQDELAKRRIAEALKDE